MPTQQLLSEQDVAATWQAYAQNRCANDLRDRLVEYYLDLGLVRRAAKRMARTLPAQVDPDELTSAGAFGLLAAVERFDPSRDIKFETFASKTIRGAMIDYLREIDHLSRVARARANKLTNATDRLRMKLGRAPGDEEIRSQLDVTGDTFMRMAQSSREGVNFSLEHRKRSRGDEDGIATIDTVAAADNAFDSLRAVIKQDVREWIGKGLSRKHRLIVLLYYFEDMSMREIGQTMGMSESRISQIHAMIIERLQRKLRDRGEELTALSA